MEFVIEGKITKKDFYRYAFKGVTLGRILYLSIVALILTWFFTPILWDDPEGKDYLLMLVGIAIFDIILTIGQTWNIVRKKPLLLQSPQRITLDEVGLRRDLSYQFNVWKWGNVTSYKETKDTLYFFLDAHMVVLLPKRFFKDREEEQAVIALVESKGTLRK